MQKSEIQRIIKLLENGEADAKTVLYELHLVYTQGLFFVLLPIHCVNAFSIYRYLIFDPTISELFERGKVDCLLTMGSVGLVDLLCRMTRESTDEKLIVFIILSLVIFYCCLLLCIIDNLLHVCLHHLRRNDT